MKRKMVVMCLVILASCFFVGNVKGDIVRKLTVKKDLRVKRNAFVDGNVGIGTTVPGGNLHVSDGNSVASSLITSDFSIISAQNTSPGSSIISASSAIVSIEQYSKEYGRGERWGHRTHLQAETQL